LNWADSSLARRQGTKAMDDEFYRDRARNIREIADKADPFIRKRLLDLAGNYDAMVRRSHRATAVAPAVLPDISTDPSPGDVG
jgi:hypothetical protein